MSMLRAFFAIGTDESLFEGLYIANNKELCAEHMGKYPVIFISLKDVNGLLYEEAFDALTQIVGNEACRFLFLLESDKLTEIEKEQYRGFLKIKDGKHDIEKGLVLSSLKVLSKFLSKHYGRKTIIIIDEYDVPLDKAFQNGYYNEMVELVRGFFGQALKTNDFLHFAVAAVVVLHASLPPLPLPDVPAHLQ